MTEDEAIPNIPPTTIAYNGVSAICIFVVDTSNTVEPRAENTVVRLAVPLDTIKTVISDVEGAAVITTDDGTEWPVLLADFDDFIDIWGRARNAYRL